MKRMTSALVFAAVALSAFAELDPVDCVLTEMGTANSSGGTVKCAVSNGNLYPVTMRPWGFGGFAPQTVPDGKSRWFYDYTGTRIYGIRQTRQPSPWIGDYGTWSFLPTTGTPAETAADRGSWYSHKAETLKPHRYSVYLSDYDVTAEVAPALHGAIARFTYPESDEPGLIVDPLPGGTVALSADRTSLVGCSVHNARGAAAQAPLRLHFTLRLDRPAVSARQLSDGTLFVRLAPTVRGERRAVRIASSFISAEQAERNLDETEGRDFEALCEESRKEWNDRLGRIMVETTNLDRRRTFYTCLFRTMLFPMALWERDAEGQIVHWSPTTGRVCRGHYFAGTGFWDTFRALFPLLNLLSPEMNALMIEGLENCWKESGWLPEWSAPGLTDCMVGNNSASVIADAWLSGVRGNFDINELWKAVVHGANNAHPTQRGTGRCGVAHYNEKGYVPRDVGVTESAARTLEYAYDDWCIAALGRAIGRPDSEVAVYARRAENWRNVFDPARRIACGRNADGTFNADFNPFSWGGDFTEGCAHHYTWSVFHDVPGLIAAMGGAAEFERRLDEIFALPPTAEYSYYGFKIHEIREMQIMNLGQYAHGNQPVQHMIYLYDWVGATAKVQRWTREVMTRLYRPTPDGYCGDEDNGQTSAWFVWSALGLYPVCPGSGEYALGAPLFDRATLALPNGRSLVIRADGAEKGLSLGKMTLNGHPLTRPFVRRDDLCGQRVDSKRDVVLSFDSLSR